MGMLYWYNKVKGPLSHSYTHSLALAQAVLFLSSAGTPGISERDSLGVIWKSWSTYLDELPAKLLENSGYEDQRIV